MSAKALAERAVRFPQNEDAALRRTRSRREGA